MASRRISIRDVILALLILHLSNGQRKIIETDNIAVPQQEVSLFALPAPGIRFGNQLRQNQAPGYPSSSNDINNLFVGHLMPLEPTQVMPVISNLDVACFPDYMGVKLSFDKPFNGVIYSKGYFGSPDCTYYSPGREQKEISFQVHGQGCGTQYIEPPGQASYMENIIVIQNEPGIQEIWDSARGLRCMFNEAAASGRSRQTVSASMNVAMLDHQVASFSADTKASASLDIQIGRGPFAPSASGLVKIGELMTMVVAVDGPPQIDLLVRQCVAHDGTHNNIIQLTDEAGCVLKKKIIGSWQKQKGEAKDGAPKVSFAHFQAFKFPDKMDVYIECEIDLCNGECPVCAEDQPDYIRRKRRSVAPSQDNDEESVAPEFQDAIDEAEFLIAKLQQRPHHTQDNHVSTNENKTENQNFKLARRLRVLSPEDISVNGDEFASLTFSTKTPSEEDSDNVCMSLASFVIGIVVMLVILVASSALTAVFCIKVRTIPSAASSFPPDSSFHAFSTVSGKNT